MPEPTPEEDLLETIDELYGAARSAVLDAARVWRIGGGAPWTVKALVAAMDTLASAEALLGGRGANVHRGSGEPPRIGGVEG